MAKRTDYQGRNHDLNKILKIIYNHKASNGLRQPIQFYSLNVKFYGDVLELAHHKLSALITQLQEDGYVTMTDWKISLTPEGTIFIEHGGYKTSKTSWSSNVIEWATNFNSLWDAIGKIFAVLVVIALAITLGIRPLRERVLRWWKDTEIETRGTPEQNPLPLDSIPPTKDQTRLDSLDSAKTK